MGQVAIAASFGCVRRFNAAIRKVYHRTPTQIRHLARQREVQPEDQYLFRLPYRPPYDWQSLLTFLAKKATPGVEVIIDRTYRRSILIQKSPGYFEVSLDRARDSLVVRVQIADPRSLFFITERVRAMFDLNADWADIVKNLRSEPTLRRLAETAPGLRVPGGWDPFELTVCAVLGQQISAAGETSLITRMVRAFGQPFIGAPGLTHLFPTAESLADADLAGLGLPASKAETIRALARAICNGQIHFEGILDLDDFLTRLTCAAGIRESTAQYVAMRALNEPDAFPSGDRGLQRGLGVRTSRELERSADAWRPWRAYAAMYLSKIEHGRGTRMAKSAADTMVRSISQPDTEERLAD
jgi:AraC family transcriptional regulator of adaptative response / DNA-3-methyladenine glycosylase II